MAERFLTFEELHRRLSDRGHSLSSRANIPGHEADVWPPPEAIVTIAIEPDWTLKPVFRERYFACVRDAAEVPDTLIADLEASFVLSGPLARTSNVGLPSNKFLAGPVRWMVARLALFPKILLWPDEESRDPSGFVCPEALAEMPRLREFLERTRGSDTPVGALLLDLGADEEAAVFWEAAALIARRHRNLYVSDEGAAEVYLLHHHDKVVVSVPDQHARWLMLEELAGLSDVFEDWSG